MRVMGYTKSDGTIIEPLEISSMKERVISGKVNQYIWHTKVAVKNLIELFESQRCDPPLVMNIHNEVSTIALEVSATEKGEIHHKWSQVLRSASKAIRGVHYGVQDGCQSLVAVTNRDAMKLIDYLHCQFQRIKDKPDLHDHPLPQDLHEREVRCADMEAAAS